MQIVIQRGLIQPASSLAAGLSKGNERSWVNAVDSKEIIRDSTAEESLIPSKEMDRFPFFRIAL
jgi:hypothetical protein